VLQILETPTEESNSSNYVNDGRLVYRVGMMSIRYVHFSFARKWSVLISNSLALTRRQKKRVAYQVHEPVEDSEDLEYQSLKSRRTEQHVPTLMWFDLTGQLNTSLLRGLSETVFGFILLRPGVSFASIFRRYQCMMNRYELSHLLESLEQREVIYHYTVPTLPSVDLFTPRAQVDRILSEDNRHNGLLYVSPNLEERVSQYECSYYFPRDNYYLKLKE
jgi:hypothetical protein